MTSGLLSISKSEGKVVTLTINRPKSLNALNTALLKELDSTLRTLSIQAEHPKTSIKALVIQGSGDKAFVAGADVKEFIDLTSDSLEQFVDLGQRVMKRISDFPSPTIAAVKGYCLGGGFELALSCDLIIASDNAIFGFPEVCLGLIPGFGGTQRILRRVGPSSAKMLVFTGEYIKSEEALRVGIVNKSFNSDSFQEDLEAFLNSLTKLPLDALQSAKRCIDASLIAAENNGLQIEKNEFVNLFFTENAIEGRLAFNENRPPRFVEP